MTGVAVGKDGSIYVADDSNGVVYRVSYDGTASAPAGPGAVPNVIADMPVSKLAVDVVDAKMTEPIKVMSSFESDQAVPLPHAADGDNASPRLSWSGAPQGTQSFVIIADDPDAAEPKPFVHWLAYDVPGTTTELREGLPTEAVLSDPKGMKQGANSSGSHGYTGPKPPLGDPAHHYHFQIFALDVPTLGLEPGAKRDAVLQAMNGHVLAEGKIVGTMKGRPQANKRAGRGDTTKIRRECARESFTAPHLRQPAFFVIPVSRIPRSAVTFLGLLDNIRFARHGKEGRKPAVVLDDFTRYAAIVDLAWPASQFRSGAIAF